MASHRRRVSLTVGLGIVVILGGSAAASAQTPPDTVPAAERSGSGRAFLYSAVLPGAGQHTIGSERWIPYVAVEAWALVRFFDRRSAGQSYQSDYRDLAWSVARTISAGPRREGSWEYYEAMAKFRASGSFDLAPDRPELVPELDESTFNGSIWALARAIYFPAGVDAMPADSPEYRQALDYYRARAIRPEFSWSWGSHDAEQQTYVELIRRSDEALRAATMMLGVLLANHVISAVDALVSARLRAAGHGAPPLELQSGLDPGSASPRWFVGARIRLPRR